MTLKELLKKTEESFREKFGITKQPKGSDVRFVYTLDAEMVESFLLSSQEEAYNLGEENMREKIEEWEPKKCSNCGEYECKEFNFKADLLQELNTNK